MKDDIRGRFQKASAEVERSMVEFLMQFQPAGELRVSDVRAIAFEARRVAFDKFFDAAEGQS